MTEITNRVTHRDNNQIACYEHDEDINAKRVKIVGGDIFIPEIKFPDSMKMDVKVIEIVKEIPVIVEKIVIKEIEKPVYIDRVVNTITEVPVFTDKIVYKEIEKPIYIEKFQVIEKPVIVKEIEIKEIDKIITLHKYPLWFIIVSTLVSLSGWIVNFIK